jgi:hypothetical protein
LLECFADVGVLRLRFLAGRVESEWVAGDGEHPIAWLPNQDWVPTIMVEMVR